MIQIPKLKFGDPASVEWCFDMAAKFKLLRAPWAETTSPCGSLCEVCSRDIPSGSVWMSGDGHAMHPACLQDLQDLYQRSGGG